MIPLDEARAAVLFIGTAPKPLLSLFLWTARVHALLGRI